jgi:hypothetical protein
MSGTTFVDKFYPELYSYLKFVKYDLKGMSLNQFKNNWEKHKRNILEDVILCIRKEDLFLGQPLFDLPVVKVYPIPLPQLEAERRMYEEVKASYKHDVENSVEGIKGAFAHGAVVRLRLLANHPLLAGKGFAKFKNPESLCRLRKVLTAFDGPELVEETQTQSGSFEP